MGYDRVSFWTVNPPTYGAFMLHEQTMYPSNIANRNWRATKRTKRLYMSIYTYINKYIHTYIDRYINRYIDRQIDRQIGRKIDT